MKKRAKPVYHNNLRDSRETLQITIEQLAEHCDVTTETIEKIEDGSYTPSVVLAMRIAEFLSRPVTELFPLPEAVPLTSAMDEERIGREVGRISYNVFLWVALTALFAAFTLQFFPGTDAVAYTLFGVWAVVGLTYLVGLSLVKGHRRLGVKLMRKTTRRKAILSTAVSALAYGALMVWWPWGSEARPHSVWSAIAHLLAMAVPWGLMMYYFNYGSWRNSGWLEGKDVEEAMKKGE